jgi:hypothetical protein
MKVTALIPDDLVNEVKKMTGGNNVTESTIIALKDFTSRKRLAKVVSKVKREPLSFQDKFTATSIRKINRKA